MDHKGRCRDRVALLKMTHWYDFINRVCHKVLYKKPIRMVLVSTLRLVIVTLGYCGQVNRLHDERQVTVLRVSGT